MLLPGRDRRACKNKFKAEDKRNPERINYTLKNAIPVGKPFNSTFLHFEFTHRADIHTLSQRSGRDFSGPTPQISVPAPLLSVDETHAGSSTSATREVLNHQPKSRRKNRSRATAQEEGLQVVGGIDDAVFNDAD
jgi:transcription factor TFIIIB component B''